MREGETDFVRRLFAARQRNFMVEHAGEQFLGALAGVTDPEEKRHIIGEQFVRRAGAHPRTGHFLDGNWILGQGTIYPGHDRIRRHRESRPDQDAPQPRRRDSEADRRRAASSSR